MAAGEARTIIDGTFTWRRAIGRRVFTRTSEGLGTRGGAMREGGWTDAGARWTLLRKQGMLAVLLRVAAI
ncbi:hypothetical protein X961_5819 [Burkholderia pseudomallei MSHR5613]|nr:hypothetical protein DO72_3739 [Burkholderia pseudomallei]KGS39101.1 hypothetical protein X961_5819 [Burkholderia pseudomallei MSHR5613]KGS53686.1 hypothetical protein X949_5660 [Burkholderia pseudomallei MSHR5609]KGS61779.1 hypothetical protein X990_5002 [Burkholderia pseudomallei MSHR4868]KGX94742.1 hypothetical protein Y023_5685 [Burkholderia pseudomallei A79D]KGX95417.1 hypothetical protein X997_5526 [Burkholderia pseudomallei A79C]